MLTGNPLNILWSNCMRNINLLHRRRRRHRQCSFITRCCKPPPHLPVNHPEHEAKGRPLKGFWPAKQFSDKLLNIEHCSVMRVLIYSIVDISVFLRASMPLAIKVLFSKLITPPELCISKGSVAWTMAETDCCLNHLNP